MAARRRLLIRAIGAFWEASPAWRRPLRRLRLELSLLRHRIRAVTVGGVAGVRVVDMPGAPPTPPPPTPTIRLTTAAEITPAEETAFVTSQTEPAVVADAIGGASLWLHAGGDLTSLPPTHLEALTLAWAATSAGALLGGWAAPSTAPGRAPDSVHQGPTGTPSNHLAIALPAPPPPPASPAAVVGQIVAHVTAAGALAGRPELTMPLTIAAGPARVRADVRPGAVVRRRLRPIDETLAGLAPVDGPRTVLFMLPYLAVGGAERLLYDLLVGLRGRARLLVVTCEPHSRDLGQTVDRCRELTPHVYTLGDWLPRPSHAGALRHLIRRWQVATVVSWNGTTLFYDLLPELASARDRPRLVAQLYHHRGGWTAHHGPRTVRALDAHIAVNTAIASTLVEDHGAPPQRVVTIHHGVPTPPLPDAAERVRRLRERRDELGLPQDAVIVGSFIRLHRQKRPHDILRLARRLADTGTHFLLAGGGPLAAAIDSELARRPIANLTRLGLRSDPERLYDAINLCLMSSSYEGLPVFLLDGLARGLPCVATAVGDIPLLLADGGGIAAGPPGDLDALERGLRTLLDSATRTREGERGRRTIADRFALDGYVAHYEEAIFPS